MCHVFEWVKGLGYHSKLLYVATLYRRKRMGEGQKMVSDKIEELDDSSDEEGDDDVDDDDDDEVPGLI